MAVIPSVPGLTVTIAVDGQALPEYDNPGIQGSETLTKDDFHLPNDHNDGLPHIVKFVESTPGKSFAIWVDRDPSFQLLSDHIAFHVLLDGRDMGRFGDETSSKDTWSLEVCETISKCPEGDEMTYTIRQFYFSELKIKDLTHGYLIHEAEGNSLSPEDLRLQKFLAEYCGTIQVQFFHMVDAGYSYYRSMHDTPSNFRSISELSETALNGRAVDCATSLKDAGLVKLPRSCRAFMYKDPRERPFAIFEFHYRSREGLIREGVIPRPPTVDSSSHLSRDELLRRVAEWEAENQRLTSELAQERMRKSHPPTGLKREAEDTPAERTYKERKLEDGWIVINLTND
ncbi:hypothetical protein VTJ04DRAFT_1904 [Mycothermus thermophilus]|uniref:uncharacterized protein n=1 Tax=Humicola insolens TaxID=85995 RepID=UPI003742DEC1